MVNVFLENHKKKCPRGSRFMPPFHQLLCNSSEIEVFRKYDKDVCACVVKSGDNKYMHTYCTKSKKLHKTKVKNFPQIKFLSCVPFVCTYCGSIFSSRELQYSSLTYFDFDGIGLTDVKLWFFEVQNTAYRGTVWRLPLKSTIWKYVLGWKPTTKYW